MSFGRDKFGTASFADTADVQVYTLDVHRSNLSMSASVAFLEQDGVLTSHYTHHLLRSSSPSFKQATVLVPAGATSELRSSRAGQTTTGSLFPLNNRQASVVTASWFVQHSYLVAEASRSSQQAQEALLCFVVQLVASNSKHTSRAVAPLLATSAIVNPDVCRMALSSTSADFKQHTTLVAEAARQVMRSSNIPWGQIALPDDTMCAVRFTTTQGTSETISSQGVDKSAKVQGDVGVITGYYVTKKAADGAVVKRF